MKNGPMPVSLNETSQAVAVVPTLEPSTTPRLARKEMTPASTSVVVKAVTALLDCTTAVARAPAANPRHRLAVTRPSHDWSAVPPTVCNSSLNPWSP